ncbi:MAG: hypothetical protein Q8R47_04105 [Nanoarchaeota archaeon]|nr:hypothetical protein [Nanoarchaeota archaeon]
MTAAKLFLKSVGKGMKGFGEKITAFVNTMLLLLVYLVGVGLTSFVARIFGKHFLERKTSKKVNSYWSDLNIKKQEREKYYKQF